MVIMKKSYIGYGLASQQSGLRSHRTPVGLVRKMNETEMTDRLQFVCFTSRIGVDTSTNNMAFNQ